MHELTNKAKTVPAKMLRFLTCDLKIRAIAKTISQEKSNVKSEPKILVIIDTGP